MTTLDQVLRRRLAVQGLTTVPFDDAAEVVRLLACVQAQDAPLARFSIAMRVRGGTDDAVSAALDAGHLVRTHILRPTWHVVAAEDLRWIQALTGARVISGMAARFRQLELDARTIDRGLDELGTLLRGGRALSRQQIATAFGEADLPVEGERVGALLMIAELRGHVCSGPVAGRTPTYGLVDERIAPTRPRDRPDAVRELVRRFFAGHGPAAVGDLQRWSTLTKRDVTEALADLGDELEQVDVDGLTLYAGTNDDGAWPSRHRAFLLPTFDEAYLTYPTCNFTRSAGHPRGDGPHRFAEAGGGVVICDRRDVGWWKRAAGRGEPRITVAVADGLHDGQRRAIGRATDRLRRFLVGPGSSA